MTKVKRIYCKKCGYDYDDGLMTYDEFVEHLLTIRGHEIFGKYAKVVITDTDKLFDDDVILE